MNDDDDRKEDFSLYTEKIIVKPSVKYKKLIRLGRVAASAVVFGVVASVVISVTYPLICDKLNIGSGTKEKLTISKDEYSSEDATAGDESEQNSGTTGDSNNSNAGTAVDYNSMVSTLRGNVENIQKSIVMVDSYRSSVGDFISDTQSTTETVGIVVGEVNSRYVVLTNYSAITDSASIVVKVSDSTEVNATLLGKDESSNLAVIAIKESDVSINERAEIVTAFMDNSYKVKQGDMVIAAGRLYGQLKAVDYGVVTNIASMSGVDNTYELLETGLTSNTGDYCFLFNGSGNMIGVSIPGTDGTVKAIGISDVKTLIETLSNGEKNRYMGIKGQNVTSVMSVKYGLPMGIYITQVEMDSPAYTAGLQTGDVITGIDGNMVLTIQAFSEKLYQCTNGQSIAVTVKRLGKDGYKELVFTVTVGEK